jgi:hypothetical protein
MTITFLCLFVHSGVQHISWCVVFLFCFSSFCVPMVPVSLDCPFVIVPSVLSNVYSNRMSFVLINNSKQLPLRTWNIVGRPLHDYISNVIFRGSEIQYEHYHRAEFSIMAGICSFNLVLNQSNILKITINGRQSGEILRFVSLRNYKSDLHLTFHKW